MSDLNEKTVHHERPDMLEPTSVAEGEARRLRLLEEIEDIGLQLSDKDQRHPSGRRLTEQEYYEWRRGALAAMKWKERGLRRLNMWLKQQRPSVGRINVPFNDKDALAVIEKAYTLYLRLRNEDVEFDPEEWDNVEALKRLAESIRTAPVAAEPPTP